MTASSAAATRPPAYKRVAFTERFAKHLDVRVRDTNSKSRPASAQEALWLAAKLRAANIAVADDDAILRVLAHNPEIVRLSLRDDGGEPGFLAYLPLRTKGLAALSAGCFDRRAPEPELLCTAGETPSALYLWCIYAPGHFLSAMSAIAAHFDGIAPDGATLFTSAATSPAARLFKSLGFRPATDHFPAAEPDVLVILRNAQESADNGKAGGAAAPGTTTRIAHAMEDVLKVFAIRAATYMNEQACPFDEEFDGNDFCAAHILGEIGGEPAGCIRIRFFSDFVKLERLAVRPEFRASSLAFRLVRAAIDYARAKGFRHVYGHARQDLVPFWARFGFREMPGRAVFGFSGVTYVEMGGPIDAAARPIGLHNTPYELIRPEGDWDRPGPLDPSAARAAAASHEKAAA